jgi:hypothetical protein
MNEKKVVGRNFAIIVCLLLWLGTIVVSVGLYSDMVNGLNAQIASKNEEIVSLNAHINNISYQLGLLQSAYQQLQSEYSNLTSNSSTSGQGLTIDAIYSESVYSGSGIFNVTVRNNYPKDVHVTSLKIYGDTTLSSNASVLVTIPANSSVTINQYVPWGPAVTARSHVVCTLTIETLEGYSGTSAPLSYQ